MSQQKTTYMCCREGSLQCRLRGIHRQRCRCRSEECKEGSPRVNISGESAPLPQLNVASDAMHVATQDNAHVPLSGMALMTGPQDSVAASPMPLGRVQGGSHVSFAGESEPLLQLSAALDAAHVATQADAHVRP